MIVRFVIYLILILQCRSGGEPTGHTVLSTKPKPSEFAIYKLTKDEAVESLESTDKRIRACFTNVLLDNPAVSRKTIKMNCAGSHNEIIRRAFRKNMKKLRRAFQNLIIVNLEPFRRQYEAEIVYLIGALNFFIDRDFKIREGLETLLKRIRYQVDAQKFENLMDILRSQISDFDKIQSKIAEIKQSLIKYIYDQFSKRDAHLKKLSKRPHKKTRKHYSDLHDLSAKT